MHTQQPSVPSRRILITGSSGLIGSYLVGTFQSDENHQVLNPSHQTLNIADEQSVRDFFREYQPEMVINLAAHRDATSAEKQRGDVTGTAWQSNVMGARNVALYCHECGAHLTHISSDYVFSGDPSRPGPYAETDEPETNDDLLSWYGITKREAEEEVQRILPTASILRINNVTRPNNVSLMDYVGKIVFLYEKKKLYPMFNDQAITLTNLPLITEVVHKIMEGKHSGVFHAASTDQCNPHQLANYVIKQKYNQDNAVEGISIDSYLQDNPRRYPKHGGLKTEITQKILGLNFSSWQKIVDLFIKKS